MKSDKRYVDVDELLKRLNGMFSVRQLDLIKAAIYSCNIKEVKNDK